MGDSAYLKKFVENHPKNKMAWYLLGKEYEASGQTGKARYCYIQAGGVYEAFEASKIPEDLWMGYKADLLQETKQREKRSRFLRKLGIALLIALVVIGHPSAYAPSEKTAEPATAGLQDEPGAETDPAVPDAKPATPPGKAPAKAGSAGSADAVKGPVFTAQGYAFGKAKAGAEALGGLIDLQNRTGAPILNAVVLGMEREGDYLLWTDGMPVVYELEQNPDQGTTTIQSYDAEACRCTPPDASGLQAAAERWIPYQESLGVLASAMQRYKEGTGAWPTGLDDLTGPFPDNWLAGSDPVMVKTFGPLLKRLQNAAGSGAAGQPSANSDAVKDSLAPEEQPYFSEPFEIIVDKKTHVLAVVSGDKLIRSYPVGLGGDRTPEGSFAISDKVINPNGRDNGEFGSRGMQLSDTNYAIHGTNDPDSIGKDESLGCIRMGKKDVEELFDLAPKGTKVTIGKGILPDLESVPKERFKLGHREDQTNPHRVYHWLN
ncbi:L,D-transpeptidase family protein [Paenibacillus macerans]|uniref:L,D-transpeptidase catalytic domain protein n=1 Tax=Paenibacillus macerans TaxID=44252 RepID=A0A090YIU6_PAEMA|nr:L,D-transpeptidase family protein [Paenibacillus macerans]KFM98409.1 L,D-transpeptidase catalytic domain protein [Paenibacillus macerans]MBS5911213.1 L,D-transpeptidase family protein [Paenibacillus macerans]MCY7562592.1 L,D-transpeptidase family protein [Paenibacillus macerans]MEC0138272.1 L,D-transpeptidase family protein [Paenibacillus macerans]MEC0149124.1 L,D-transpeptidase family protein [Paenibacillus macerans]